MHGTERVCRQTAPERECHWLRAVPAGLCRKCIREQILRSRRHEQSTNCARYAPEGRIWNPETEWNRGIFRLYDNRRFTERAFLHCIHDNRMLAERAFYCCILRSNAPKSVHTRDVGNCCDYSRKGKGEFRIWESSEM